MGAYSHSSDFDFHKLGFQFMQAGKAPSRRSREVGHQSKGRFQRADASEQPLDKTNSRPLRLQPIVRGVLV
jgi:hypothetical protein